MVTVAVAQVAQQRTVLDADAATSRKTPWAGFSAVAASSIPRS
jgi:hypothetical protein